MPTRSARSAGMRSAEKNISFTTVSGRRLMKLRIPATLYGSPSFAGVMAKAQVSSPITMSQAMTRSHAPPHAEPCTMAITGAGNALTARSSCSSGSL